MKEEKKEFTKAEVEVIKFEKNDVITTSGCNPDVGYQEDDFTDD